MRLLKLPAEVQNMVIDKKLTMSHVRPLLALDSEDDMTETARRIQKEKLSVREVEKYIRERNKPKPVRTHTDDRDPAIRALEERMSEKLGTQVTFRKNAFTIAFADVEDMNRILELLGCLEESLAE